MGVKPASRYNMVRQRISARALEGLSHAVNSEILQVIELADDTGNVAHAIAVAVLVRTWVNLVDDGIWK